jgi:hypothetical protein
VRSLGPWQQANAEFVMTARNTRRIGDTERTRSATFLFNHFSADDAAAAVGVWEELAGWYTAKAGVDNSTLLQPTSERALRAGQLRPPAPRRHPLPAHAALPAELSHLRPPQVAGQWHGRPAHPVQTCLTDHGG